MATGARCLWNHGLQEGSVGHDVAKPQMDSLAVELAEEWKRRPAGLPADSFSHGSAALSPEVLEDSIVVIGPVGDEHVAAVADALNGRDTTAVVLEVGAASQARPLTYRPSAEHIACRSLFCRSTAVTRSIAHHNERTLYDPCVRPLDELDTQQFRNTERCAAVLGLAALLDSPFSMNSPWGTMHAEQKPAQLSAADRCGLSTPRTVITDEAQAIRDFAAEVDGTIVYKSLDDPVVWRHGERAGFLFTSIVGTETMEALPGRLDCPGIFQEKLEVEAEYRVTVVGERTFSARCTAPSTGEVDWRRGLLAGVDFESVPLDSEIESKVISLVAELGLEFAAVDLATDGEQFHLLEVNPDGAYLWLERLLQLPITETICDQLIAAARNE